MTIPRTPDEAIAWCKAHPTNKVRACQEEAHEAYNVPSNGDATAYIDYQRSAHKHGPAAPRIPGGLARWKRKTGDGNPGHVAPFDHDTDKVWSTDWPTDGHRSLVSVAELTQDWDLEFLGWTEEVDGVPVATPPSPKPQRPAPVRAVLQAGRATKAALKTAIAKASGPVQAKRLERAARKNQAVLDAAKQVKPK